jgi:DNA-binding beta-propeller fold protein YncE
LTPGSPTGISAVSVAFSSSGGLLATANRFGNTVSVYSVNATTDALTPEGSTAAGTYPSSVAFSPGGGLLATTSAGDNTVSVYSVSATGVPTYDASTSVSGDPESVAFSPSGLLATASYVGNAVSVFSVNASTEALTPVTGSPFSTGTNSFPNSVTFSPSGGLLAIADSGTGAVSVLSMDAPTAAITSPAGGGSYPVGQSVTTSFSCADAYVPGISSCQDSNGATNGAGSLNTSAVGSHSYTVTATSQDGQTATHTITYTVLAPPTVTITSPAGGSSYTVGQSVPTSFSCADATGAPGISSCQDANGATDGTGMLDTSTAGSHSYTVTATSQDGQTGTQKITYTVQGTPTNPSPNPPVTTPAPQPPTPPAILALNKLRVSSHTVRWCQGCQFPSVRLSFKLNQAATVHLTLLNRRHGTWRQVATATSHRHAGQNQIRLAGRWHGNLVPTGAYRIIFYAQTTTQRSPKRSITLNITRP